MIYWDGNFMFPYPTAGSAAVINDFAKFQNPSHGHCHNYFRGCRQREKKSPINDFLKRWWWHPGWQHRIAMGCVNQSRTIRIDFTLSLSPPYRTVSPELKSYALGVLFLLLRLLGRYKKISSSSPTLPSLTDNTIFNMQELISLCVNLHIRHCGCHEWGLKQWGLGPPCEGCCIKAPEGAFPAIWIVLMEENVVLHEKWPFLPRSHADGSLL